MIELVWGKGGSRWEFWGKFVRNVRHCRGSIYVKRMKICCTDAMIELVRLTIRVVYSRQCNCSV